MASEEDLKKVAQLTAAINVFSSNAPFLIDRITQATIDMTNISAKFEALNSKLSLSNQYIDKAMLEMNKNLLTLKNHKSTISDV